MNLAALRLKKEFDDLLREGVISNPTATPRFQEEVIDGIRYWTTQVCWIGFDKFGVHKQPDKLSFYHFLIYMNRYRKQSNRNIPIELLKQIFSFLIYTDPILRISVPFGYPYRPSKFQIIHWATGKSIPKGLVDINGYYPFTMDQWSPLCTLRTCMLTMASEINYPEVADIFCEIHDEIGYTASNQTINFTVVIDYHKTTLRQLILFLSRKLEEHIPNLLTRSYVLNPRDHSTADIDRFIVDCNYHPGRCEEIHFNLQPARILEYLVSKLRSYF